MTGVTFLCGLARAAAGNFASYVMIHTAFVVISRENDKNVKPQ
jgi:hypothetical protein